MSRARAACALVGLAACLCAPALRADPALALRVAGEALRDDLPGVAERHYRLVLAGAADEADLARAALGLVEALARQDRAADALAAAEQATPRLQAEADHLRLRYWRAWADWRLGDAEAARRQLADLDVATLEPDTRTAVLHLRARCAADLGRTAEALQGLQELEEQAPSARDRATIQLDTARLLVTLDRTGEAELALNAVIAAAPAAPEGAEARYWLGRIAAQRRDWIVAESNLLLAARAPVASPTRRGDAWFELAETYDARGLATQAVAALEAALPHADGADASNRVGVVLGQVLLRMGRVEEGLPHLKRFIASAAGRALAPSLQLHMADALLQAGQAERAAEEYQHYLEAFADPAGTLHAVAGRARSLTAAGGRLPDAAGGFERAAELSPTPEAAAEYWVEAGRVWHRAGRTALATQAFGRVVARLPGSEVAARASLHMAESLHAAGLSDEAEAVLRALADVAPPAVDEQALLLLGQIQDAAGRSQAALETYARARTLHPDGARAALALSRHGMAAYRLYRFEEALASFDEVLVRFPDAEPAEYAMLMRGHTLFMIYRVPEALRTWQDFLARHPGSRWAGDALFALGRHAYNAGRFPEAESNLVAVADLQPPGPLVDDALLLAGRAATEQKEYARALERFERLLRDLPDSPRTAEARYHQGDALCGLGRFSDAILVFDEILTRHADHFLRHHAWRRKGDSQFTLGSSDPARYDEAMLSYGTVVAAPDAPLDLVLQAEYMIGRCEEQRNHPDAALDQYYRAITRYLEARNEGHWPSDAARHWFTRAAYNAVDILSAREQWRQVVRVLRRLVEADVPAARDAQRQIDEIRARRWWTPL